MARIILSLVLLLCVGSAILELVSAEQQNQESHDSLNQAIEATNEEVNKRVLRKVLRDVNDAKRRRKTRKNKTGKNKKTEKQKNKKRNKKKRKTKRGKKDSKKRTRKARRGKKKKNRKLKRRNMKKNKQNRKKIKKIGSSNSKNSTGSTNSTGSANSTCDVKGLCQKIKNYIKYSNQLRKLRRINKTCTTMKKKRDKALEGEFSPSAEANADSGNDTVNQIADELKKCTDTAKTNCETTEITGCTNGALNTKCEEELQTWLKKFGPAKGSCLAGSKDCCKCINDIKPAPSAECLKFEELDTASKEKKKKCIASSTQGSFGYCRKLQMEAAEKGPKAHQAKCHGKGKPTGVTKAAGRRMAVRNNFLMNLSNL